MWVVGLPANRLLRFGLGLLALIPTAWTAWSNVIVHPFGGDLEIPLRAATRWLDGEPVYLASAFSAPPGPGQPFLYPPYVLPLVAPFTLLPLEALKVAWLVLLVGSLRRRALRRDPARLLVALLPSSACSGFSSSPWATRARTGTCSRRPTS